MIGQPGIGASKIPVPVQVQARVDQVEDHVELGQQEDVEQEVAGRGFENVLEVQDRAKHREVDDPPPSRPRAGSRRSPLPRLNLLRYQCGSSRANGVRMST